MAFSISNIIQTTFWPVAQAAKGAVAVAKHSVPHHPATGAAAWAAGKFAQQQAAVRLPGILLTAAETHIKGQFASPMVGTVVAKVTAPSLVAPVLPVAVAATACAVTVGIIWAGNAVQKRMTPEEAKEPKEELSLEGWEEIPGKTPLKGNDPLLREWVSVAEEGEAKLFSIIDKV